MLYACFSYRQLLFYYCSITSPLILHFVVQVKVLGSSNYHCKLVSPLLSSHGLEKSSGRARPLRGADRAAGVPVLRAGAVHVQTEPRPAGDARLWQGHVRQRPVPASHTAGRHRGGYLSHRVTSHRLTIGYHFTIESTTQSLRHIGRVLCTDSYCDSRKSSARSFLTDFPAFKTSEATADDSWDS